MDSRMRAQVGSGSVEATLQLVSNARASISLFLSLAPYVFGGW